MGGEFGFMLMGDNTLSVDASPVRMAQDYNTAHNTPIMVRRFLPWLKGEMLMLQRQLLFYSTVWRVLSLIYSTH